MLPPLPYGGFIAIPFAHCQSQLLVGPKFIFRDCYLISFFEGACLILMDLGDLKYTFIVFVSPCEKRLQTYPESLYLKVPRKIFSGLHRLIFSKPNISIKFLSCQFTYPFNLDV
jgi:hypothetical protein